MIIDPLFALIIIPFTLFLGLTAIASAATASPRWGHTFLTTAVLYWLTLFIHALTTTGFAL